MSACFRLRKESIIKVCKHRIGLVNLRFDVQSRAKIVLPINTGVLQGSLRWKETSAFTCCAFALQGLGMLLNYKGQDTLRYFFLTTQFCIANSSNCNFRFQEKVHLATSQLQRWVLDCRTLFPVRRQQLIEGELQVDGVNIPPTEALGVQIGYCPRGVCDD